MQVEFLKMKKPMANHRLDILRFIALEGI